MVVMIFAGNDWLAVVEVNVMGLAFSSTSMTFPLTVMTLLVMALLVGNSSVNSGLSASD